MAALLEPPREIVEESTLRSDKYSAIEGEILTALEAARSAPSKLQRTPKRVNPRFFRVSDLARNP